MIPKNPPKNTNLGMSSQQEMQDFHVMMRQMQDEMFEKQWRKIARKGLDGIVKKSFVKQMHSLVMTECNRKLMLFGYNPLELGIALDTLEQGRVIEQIYYYHLFYTSHLPDDVRAAKQRDNAYRSELVGIVSGNLLVGGLHKVDLLTATVANSPEIIAYKIYADRMLSTIQAYQAAGGQLTVIDALIQHAMGMVKGIVDLLADAVGSSAVALWRQLHEVECVILAILKGGNAAAQAYWEHRKFFELEHYDDDELEAELLKELAKYGLDKPPVFAAKNRRSYINYGWLLAIPEFAIALNKPYKLDFKNGVEAFAGQSSRFGAYAEASKVIHSSANMLIIGHECYL